MGTCQQAGRTRQPVHTPLRSRHDKSSAHGEVGEMGRCILQRARHTARRDERLDHGTVTLRENHPRGGEYKRDLITYTRNGRHVKANCHRWKKKDKKKPLTESAIELEADGLTLDMLSSFYYMRSLDYASMKPGDKKTLNVFSGKRKELLTITYHGMEDVTIDKTVYPAYKISFSFTGEGGKKTSDDMEAWISTAAGKIPLKLEGKLPVGKVQCFYVK